MISITALALLAAVALLLLRPQGVFSQSLQIVSRDYPRVVLGLVLLFAIVVGVATLWPTSERREADAEGYGELWYMVETAPELREPARHSLADGRLTNEELENLRTQYRQAPDVATMREGVARELSR